MNPIRRANRSEELLLERERQGVRTLTIMRGIFVLIVATSVWFIGASSLDRIATSVLALLVLAGVGICLFYLPRRANVVGIGLVGCMIDISIVAVLPVIWYFSVGGSSVPPAFMLKTQISILTLALVALNALALRPLYPIVVAVGGIGVHLTILTYVLRQPDTIISSDFVTSALGPALNLGLVFSSMLVIGLTGVALAYLTWLVRRTVAQGVQLEVTNAQFSRYFSPGVVTRIASDADNFSGVGGRTQDVAVMFCDIRDFTAITENLPPSQVVAFLSEYHTCMLEVVFQFGGTIDKFIGDAIMVTFGTPDPADDDVERSVRAGMAMNDALTQLNIERGHKGQVALRQGIGIHYGPVVAGNIGTEARMEYTVIGDTVNVADRIQNACKALGETLLISEAVKQQLPSDIQVRSLSSKNVKGRHAPVELYAIIPDP